MANTPTPAQQTAGHTATPWTVVDTHPQQSCVYIQAANGDEVAVLYASNENYRRDAIHAIVCVNGFDALFDSHTKLQDECEEVRKREAALQAENERLRAVLQRLLSSLDESDSGGFMSVVNAKAAARAALNAAKP